MLSTPEMKELHRRIQDLRHQLPESRQQVKKILQPVARNEELEREIRDRKTQIAEAAGKGAGGAGENMERVENSRRGQIPSETCPGNRNGNPAYRRAAA
ncbi:MAG: hypothetical protein KAR73_12215 [Spirochaetales bacterium]|nr:hypothetical protein [Spirochaetales bacterium]